MAKVRWSYSATFLYPDSRLPTPDSRLPTPYSLLPIPYKPRLKSLI
ncbi:MAG: hypothetical protein F6K26_06940 [Moorea sp. SIO2I5]|nr:hypothetical protein [Moorena sp. SIO2I5]